MAIEAEDAGLAGEPGFAEHENDAGCMVSLPLTTLDESALTAIVNRVSVARWVQVKHARLTRGLSSCRRPHLPCRVKPSVTNNSSSWRLPWGHDRRTFA